MEIMYLNEDNIILSNKNFISFIGEVNDLEILSPNINKIILKPTKKVKSYIKNIEYFKNLKLDDISKKKIENLSSYELMCTKLLSTINKNPKVIILYNIDFCICEKYKNKFLNFIRLINAEKQIKFIIISNNTVFLNNISKDIIVMKNQIIKYQGTIINGIKAGFIPKNEIINFIDEANKEKDANLDYYLETKELLKAIYRSVF
ncbi:MAG: hypothetical protein Q4C33_00585 [bacterium]|nr:hypothetical protein [bacterium]